MGPTFAAEAKSPQQQDVGILCEKRLIRKKSISVTYFEWLRLIRISLHKNWKYALLIIDEWLLYPLKETEARDLLEIVESRYKRNSTIFCSQFDIPGWPEKLSDPLLADAICDRIVHDTYTIVIGGKESMRKRKGLQDI